MFNLSLTACSFHLRKLNSKGNNEIYNLNEEISIKDKDGNELVFKDASEMFIDFFGEHKELIKDDTKQQSFSGNYVNDMEIETEDFEMFCFKIVSGNYGSSSDIIDGTTQAIKYKKKSSDIDTRPFYFMIVIPKDNEKVTVQKGMFIFQNVGPFGIKTITTSLMKNYFAEKFNITLKCNTISSKLFIQRVISKENIKKLVMIKNIKSSDVADNIGKGYGSEVREISKLHFTPRKWDDLMGKIRYVAGGKYNLFEFENTQYDNLKVVVDIGGRSRKISLHHLENLSIIEAIPDEIQMADGHPDFNKLVEHCKSVAAEYLEEMVLQIT